MSRGMSVELPRRAQRRSVALPAQCRTRGGLRHGGEISNISTQGCCVRTVDLPLRVGSHVMIRPKGMEPLGGTVRWVARDCAGVEFDRAIDGPVLDRLAQMHEAGAPGLLSRG
jgi:PilZ domain